MDISKILTPDDERWGLRALEQEREVFLQLIRLATEPPATLAGYPGMRHGCCGTLFRNQHGKWCFFRFRKAVLARVEGKV